LRFQKFIVRGNIKEHHLSRWVFYVWFGRYGRFSASAGHPSIAAMIANASVVISSSIETVKLDLEVR